MSSVTTAEEPLFETSKPEGQSVGAVVSSVGILNGLCAASAGIVESLKKSMMLKTWRKLFGRSTGVVPPEPPLPPDPPLPPEPPLGLQAGSVRSQPELGFEGFTGKLDPGLKFGGAAPPPEPDEPEEPDDPVPEPSCPVEGIPALAFEPGESPEPSGVRDDDDDVLPPEASDPVFPTLAVSASQPARLSANRAQKDAEILRTISLILTFCARPECEALVKSSLRSAVIGCCCTLLCT